MNIEPITMKSNILKISILVAAVSLTSCKYQKNNKAVQTDKRDGDTWVYGVHPDSAAVQSKLKYEVVEADSLEKRTALIRDKFFGAGTISQGN
jgi:hypothetical protein